MGYYTLSILIPAYNEEKTICRILDKICKVSLINNIKKEIIIIDDGSSDNTFEQVQTYAQQTPETIILLCNNGNEGKGAAIRNGIKHATGTYCIVQDADLEYDPEDYNIILKELIDNKRDVVYGSRFLMKENKHSYKTFYLGGLLVTLFTNILYNQRLTDEPTCYKAFRTSFLQSIPLNCTGFEFCPEVTAKTARKGIKIKEVPIRYYPRSIEEGKKIRWTDGVEALWILLKYRFSK